MIENKDYGLGKCKCGKWAIVGINDNRLCPEHMDAAFKKIGSELRHK